MGWEDLVFFFYVLLIDLDVVVYWYEVFVDFEWLELFVVVEDFVVWLVWVRVWLGLANVFVYLL